MDQNTPTVLEASGLWSYPLKREAFDTVRAYYTRPWKGCRCSVDDIVLHCVDEKVQFYPMLLMATAAGEYQEE